MSVVVFQDESGSSIATELPLAQLLSWARAADQAARAYLAGDPSAQSLIEQSFSTALSAGDQRTRGEAALFAFMIHDALENARGAGPVVDMATEAIGSPDIAPAEDVGIGSPDIAPQGFRGENPDPLSFLSPLAPQSGQEGMAAAIPRQGRVGIGSPDIAQASDIFVPADPYERDANRRR